MTETQRKLSLQQHSAIFKLPVEILEAIFITCVRGHSWPGFLAEVCAEWRVIALGCAQLWTKIDITFPKRAKDFFSLTRRAPLSVTWNYTDLEDGDEEVAYLKRRDWIWQHCDRLEKLSLAGPACLVEHSFRQLSVELPILKNLSVENRAVYDERGNLKRFDENIDDEDLERWQYANISMQFSCPLLRRMDLE